MDRVRVLPWYSQMDRLWSASLLRASSTHWPTNDTYSHRHTLTWHHVMCANLACVVPLISSKTEDFSRRLSGRGC